MKYTISLLPETTKTFSKYAVVPIDDSNVNNPEIHFPADWKKRFSNDIMVGNKMFLGALCTRMNREMLPKEMAIVKMPDEYKLVDTWMIQSKEDVVQHKMKLLIFTRNQMEDARIELKAANDTLTKNS